MKKSIVALLLALLFAFHVPAVVALGADGDSAPAEPSVNITNGLSLDGKLFGYRSSFIFARSAEGLPDGCVTHWLLDGSDTGSSAATYSVKRAKKDFTVQCVAFDEDGGVAAASKIITIRIDDGFFSRLRSFFLMIFGKLPTYS